MKSVDERYRETLDFMFAQLPMYQRQGAPAFKKTLDNIIALCALLDNPQDKLKVIHVAGTNGKGSTSHIIASVLQAHGLKVGLYTSPHYKDFRERIKVNASFISKEEVVVFMEDHATAIREIQPSFFEITVALAFYHFYSQKVDLAVVEVGLGGRLDSTNIVKPQISVITNISFDHQAMLGNTLVKIAGEKAGIIKPNIPVVVGERQKEVARVFIDRTELLNCDLQFASDRISIQKEKRYLHILVDGEFWLKRMKFSLEGPFQEKNLKTALMTLFQLRKQYGFKKSLIKKGVKEVQDATYFIGRWQKLGRKPIVVADSAHNEAGLRLVMGKIKSMTYDKLHIVLGFVTDKDVEKALRLFPSSAIYYFAKANIPRGMNAKKLQEVGMQNNLIGETYNSVEDAFEAAKKAASTKDMIFVGGSIFVVAEVI